ncbi:hypothetical protein [Maricaulis sp.]|uniref:hypothetical protein n=1 Tax=Maricaulis sp. TaxID=1486257 RepID=UPI003A8F754F
MEKTGTDKVSGDLVEAVPVIRAFRTQVSGQAFQYQVPELLEGKMFGLKKSYRVGDEFFLGDKFKLIVRNPDDEGLVRVGRDIRNIEVLSLWDNQGWFLKYKFPFDSDVENYIGTIIKRTNKDMIELRAFDYHGIEYEVGAGLRSASPTGRRKK